MRGCPCLRVACKLSLPWCCILLPMGVEWVHLALNGAEWTHYELLWPSCLTSFLEKIKNKKRDESEVLAPCGSGPRVCWKCMAALIMGLQMGRVEADVSAALPLCSSWQGIFTGETGLWPCTTWNLPRSAKKKLEGGVLRRVLGHGCCRNTRPTYWVVLYLEAVSQRSVAIHATKHTANALAIQ